MQIFVLTLVLCGLTVVFASPVEINLIGGADTVPGEFPSQASIQIRPVGGEDFIHECGAVIVDENHVLTAAHCVLGASIERISVTGGMYDISEDGESTRQTSEVRRLVYHPDYDQSDLLNDLAVVTLRSPFRFSDKVNSIALAPRDHETSGPCVSTGWGNATESTVLQKVLLNTVPRGTCQNRYFLVRPIDDSMICAAAGDDRGTCDGDDGGPLVCYDLDGGDQYLAGVSSWAMTPCGQSRYPSVFANIAHMREFIDTELARP